MKTKRGLIHVYTGSGKGKTTAAIGLALRALGQGLRVYMIQFLKGGAYTGELIAADNFLDNFNIVQFGKGCPKSDTQLSLTSFNCPKGHTVRDEISCGDCRLCFQIDDDERVHARLALENARHILQKENYDMLILDEVNCAIKTDLIKVKDILELLELKPENVEIVLTGRDAPDELIDVADYVTEMREVKHPFANGIESRRGIEY
ncbi:cob(I)yrinic acid a,c-diamide adenosyltransferase [Candidatus Woesearchaeota archaeon]|nr:MAG: cob(I)yrinic acid a,c-diamide adenosyltransferase [Candidatus Woesearchaeota archaeon]